MSFGRLILVVVTLLGAILAVHLASKRATDQPVQQPFISTPTIAPPPEELPTTATPEDIKTIPWLSSQVLDASTGQPIRGARVELLRSTDLHTSTQLVTVTDDNGCYRVERAPTTSRSNYAIVVRAQGYISGRISGEQVESGSAWFVHPTRLVAGHAVGGTVLLPHGVAANTGEVLVIDEVCGAGDGYYGWPVGVTTPISATGKFETFARGPWVRVVARVPGYGPAITDPVHVDASTSLVLVVDSASPLEGQVLDEFAQPVSGALVEANGQRYGLGSSTFKTRTDASGAFEFAGLSHEDRVMLSVLHPGYLPARSLLSGLDPVELVLLAGSTIRFKIRDATGELLTGRLGTLTLVDGSRLALRPVGLEYSSDPFGTRFTSGRLSMEGCSDMLLSWSAGAGEKNLGTVTVERVPSRVVTVFDPDGVRLPGALVSILPDSHTSYLAPEHSVRSRGSVTGPDGSAVIENAQRGQQRIHVTHPQFPCAIKALTGSEKSARVHLSAGATVDLTVDTDGEECTQLTRLALRPTETTIDHGNCIRWKRQANASGRFRISGVAPNCELLATITAEGCIPAQFGLVPLRPGETRELHVSLLTGLSVACHVVDESGMPVTDAELDLSVVELEDPLKVRSEVIMPALEMRPDGIASAGGLPAGVYKVSASRKGHLPGSLEVRTAAAPSRLVIPRVPPLRMRVVFDDGFPVVGAKIQVESRGFSSNSDINKVTDELGTVDLPVALDSNPVVSVRWHNVRRRFEDVRELQKEIVLQRGADLVVDLLTASGRPFPEEATLIVKHHNSQIPRHTLNYYPGFNRRKGDHLTWSRGLSPGTVTIIAWAAGYPTTATNAQLVKGSERFVDIRMGEPVPSIACEMRVIGPRGHPLANAVVESLMGLGDPIYGWHALPTLTTDDEGYVELLMSRGHPYALTIEKPGFVSDMLEVTGGMVPQQVQLHRKP